jgi:hypothetical protein
MRRSKKALPSTLRLVSSLVHVDECLVDIYCGVEVYFYKFAAL